MKKLLYIILFVPLALFGQLTPCEQDVANSTGMIGEFVPQCEEDGSYSPIQCWFSTGYCWCVDENGVEISGTSIQSWLGTPDCSINNACTLLPEPGPCLAAVQAFYFNQETQQCDDFTWGGCAGVVPFITLSDCEAASCSENIQFLGCTDLTACNYNPNSTDDDGSCIYAEQYYNCDGSCINDIDTDGECDEVDYDDGIGIDEIENNQISLIRIIDILG